MSTVKGEPSVERRKIALSEIGRGFFFYAEILLDYYHGRKTQYIVSNSKEKAQYIVSKRLPSSPPHIKNTPKIVQKPQFVGALFVYMGQKMATKKP